MHTRAAVLFTLRAAERNSYIIDLHAGRCQIYGSPHATLMCIFFFFLLSLFLSFFIRYFFFFFAKIVVRQTRRIDAALRCTAVK